MSASLYDLLHDKTALEIINVLACYIDKEPFRTMKRGKIADIPEEMRIILLIADFEAEFCMNGMFGFLENSSGLYLDETIDAFRCIGARDVVETLVHIRTIMTAFGVSPQMLRGDFEGLEEFQIISSVDLHGKLLDPMIDQIESVVQEDFYLRKPGDQTIFDLLSAYIDGRRPHIYTWAQQYHIGQG